MDITGDLLTLKLSDDDSEIDFEPREDYYFLKVSIICLTLFRSFFNHCLRQRNSLTFVIVFYF